jgi:hypothetical protein
VHSEQYRERAFLPAFAALLVAIGFTASGCGGSESSDPLTKSEFTQQANSICRSATQDRGEAQDDATEQGTGEGASSEARYFLTEVSLPPVQTMTEELGELNAPRGKKKEVRAIIAAFEQGVAQIEADPADLSAAVVAFDKGNELAEEYGLTDCVI